jgi:hypothetical protein
MGRVCSIQIGISPNVLVRKHPGRVRLRERGVEGRIILKAIFINRAS